MAACRKADTLHLSNSRLRARMVADDDSSEGQEVNGPRLADRANETEGKFSLLMK